LIFAEGKYDLDLPIT